MRHWLLPVLAVLVVAAGPARAGARGEAVDMKLRVWLTPGRIGEVADRVLEFYEVGPESFVAAFTGEDYDWLVGSGYVVDVLVRDMREAAAQFDAFFHTYQQIRDTWAIVAQDHPNICVLDTLGTSANGNLLLAMKVSDNPAVMEGEPRICFDFTIHGNENNGTEIAHHVLLELVNGYGTDPDITRWVNSREIWLIPMVNPDGLISRSRTNGHGVDCNRNYGYAWSGGGSGVFSEPETRALYHLGVANPMAMWTQYHSGTEAAMWPWGYTQLATMDSVVHRYEMVRYGQLSGYPAFQISRGLYPVNGGSTDWYYGATGAQGYGVEVCNGQPSQPTQIDEINAENWQAMKEMIERVAWGIGGRVRDSVSGAPLEARVEVTPPDWFTYSDSTGHFHKNLHAGTYSVTVRANGYASRTLPGIVVPAEASVWLELALSPDSTAAPTAFRSITNKLGNANPANAWWALGPRDGRRFALDKGAWASFDMGRSTPIVNGPGNDFFVVEDDGDPEACSVFVSNDWNGPWHYVGFGTGTQGYDLQAAGQTLARFVRIADDNVGTGGFDIDAIEAVVVNAPALVLTGRAVIDSPPGGNADGKLDPGERADLVLELRNMGRVGVSGLTGVLRTGDAMVSVLDSAGTFGDLAPDSTRRNHVDRFVVAADAATPREHAARMVLHLAGTDYADSIAFIIVVGELRAHDPIPDGPRQPALYWAYDDGDSGYAQAPVFEWIDIAGVGTRLNITSDDQTVQFSLPGEFGPFYFYGRRFTQLSVCGNGWVGPGYTTRTAYSNISIPATNTATMLALVWDDLYPPTSGGVWWHHDAANHRLIVQYDSMPTYANRNVYDWFQVVIHDTTLAAPDGNSVFTCQYLTANSYNACTIGANDSTTGTGIQVLFDGSLHRAALPVEAGRAIRFTTDAPSVGLAEGPTPKRPAPARLAVEGNPFTGSTVIRYTVGKPGRVTLALYDNAGRRVRVLAAAEQAAGGYRLRWPGDDEAGRSVAAGVYWLRLETPDGVVTGKVVRLD
jgi:hypothetical protein